MDTVAHPRSQSTCVASLDWEQVMAREFPQTEPPVRRIFRAAVAEVARKAKDALPEANGRIDLAVKLVLSGDVEPTGNGDAVVGSQSSGDTAYMLVSNRCDCPDYERAPQHFCKHKLAWAIYRRATEAAKGQLAAMEQQQEEQVNEHDAWEQAGPAPATPAPDWRQHEPPFVHSLKWVQDGIEHMTVIRASTAAELWEQVGHVTRMIRAARQQTQATPPPAAAPEPRCPTHGTQRMMRSKYSPETWICSVQDDERAYCNQKWQATTA